MIENEGPNFGLGVLHIADGPYLNGERKSSCLSDTDAYQILTDS
jgi:hypothetical protein